MQSHQDQPCNTISFGDLVIPGSLHLLKKEQALNTILLFENITITFYVDIVTEVCEEMMTEIY